MLEDGRGPADEEDEVTKFPPKAQKHCKTNLSGKFQIRPTNSGISFSKFDYFKHKISLELKHLKSNVLNSQEILTHILAICDVSCKIIDQKHVYSSLGSSISDVNP